MCIRMERVSQCCSGLPVPVPKTGKIPVFFGPGPGSRCFGPGFRDFFTPLMMAFLADDRVSMKDFFGKFLKKILIFNQKLSFFRLRRTQQMNPMSHHYWFQFWRSNLWGRTDIT